jgi:hypothetical protein
MKQAIARAARQAWFSVFPRHPYEYAARAGWLGRLVRRLPRSYVAQREEAFFTGGGGLMGAIVRAEIERQYYASPDAVQRRRTRDFWGGEAGRAWHADKLARYGDRERFEREFLPFRQPLIDALIELCRTDSRFSTLCEIGTGNGVFLRHLSERLTALERFVGIDLSAAQIAENRKTYRDTKLEFLCAEALDWIASEGRAGTVFVACGTLECLPQEELRILLRRVADACAPAAFGIVEPVNIDLDRQFESRPRGALTFSHNYPRLFEAAGFRVLRLHRTPIDKRVAFYENVALLAIAEGQHA